MPFSEDTSPSMGAVTLCSTTFAETSGQLTLMARVFPCRPTGSMPTSIIGVSAAPTTISTTMVRMTEKLDSLIALR